MVSDPAGGLDVTAPETGRADAAETGIVPETATVPLTGIGFPISFEISVEEGKLETETLPIALDPTGSGLFGDSATTVDVSVADDAVEAALIVIRLPFPSVGFIFPIRLLPVGNGLSNITLLTFLLRL